MLHKKRKKETGNAARASLKKEMAKPRMARSARIAELNLDTSRIPEQPSTTLPGTVDKIIPSSRPSLRERSEVMMRILLRAFALHSNGCLKSNEWQCPSEPRFVTKNVFMWCDAQRGHVVWVITHVSQPATQARSVG